ncbi:MAG TPA: hypothetical protein VMR00_16000 [Streptosporangiaceae bacterium]|jgi:hypothetical protein|nr:hypothetical protein [Streptosporangiaceae bacterium]
MSPIEALALVVVGAASVSLGALVIIVTLGIRHEERALTMTRRMAPGLAAWLARQIVGLHVRKTDPEPVPGDDRVPPRSPAHRS